MDHDVLGAGFEGFHFVDGRLHSLHQHHRLLNVARLYAEAGNQGAENIHARLSYV